MSVTQCHLWLKKVMRFCSYAVLQVLQFFFSSQASEIKTDNIS